MSGGRGARSDPIAVALITFLVLALLFVVAPIAIVVVNSFNSVSYGAWPPPSFSLRWYANLADQAEFAGAAVRSIEIGLAATAASLVTGTLAALALVRLRFRGKDAVNALLLSPLIVPKIALGLGGFVLFLRLGVYGSLPSLFLAHWVLTLPFMVSIVAAGLVRVHPSLEEAAMDLGATRVRAFLEVTVPQLRRSLTAACVLSFVVSFDEVDASIFLVAPRAPTLPTAMYTYMQKFQDPTLAALSTVLIAGTLLLAIGVFMFSGPGGVTQLVAAQRTKGE